MISEIELATERLDRLVGNLLDVSRVESGNVRPRLDQCDVAELIHVAVAETEQALACHKLSVCLAKSLPLVRVDFVLMQQVLSNLLSNAATHTPPGTHVEVSAKVQNQSLRLTVTDSGPGIAAESLPHIFKKFYRAPNAPIGGTGLGLSLVKGFVEAHGGRVLAENRKGGGAVFTVFVPLRAVIAFA
jgi:two-component system sensor histidine kinase KdpD